MVRWPRVSQLTFGQVLKVSRLTLGSHAPTVGMKQSPRFVCMQTPINEREVAVKPRTNRQATREESGLYVPPEVWRGLSTVLSLPHRYHPPILSCPCRRLLP